VKVRQIASLADDLALAMRAASIRIVAPIPGKGAVGIEVPNATREMVAFRDLVESREFQDAKAALPVALGKDLEGRPVGRGPGRRCRTCSSPGATAPARACA
jgi:S-DNA-T family DNA segregation ATPase FtsK/SpoIIIE